MRTGLCLLAAVVALLWPPPRAFAADLAVSIDDGQGHPVADAVVTLVRSDQAIAQAHSDRAPASRTIDQKALAFVPYMEIFRTGDSVVFRNSDRTRHHVYSFSPVRQFEFVLAPGQSSQPLPLEQPGVVAVGCNIHDQMIAYLYVSDAPWIARSGADGRVAFHGLPAGAYAVKIWQPRLRPGRQPPSRSVDLTASGSRRMTFALSLLPDTRHRYGHEHSSY